MKNKLQNNILGIIKWDLTPQPLALIKTKCFSSAFQNNIYYFYDKRGHSLFKVQNVSQCQALPSVDISLEKRIKKDETKMAKKIKCNTVMNKSKIFSCENSKTVCSTQSRQR